MYLTIILLGYTQIDTYFSNDAEILEQALDIRRYFCEDDIEFNSIPEISEEIKSKLEIRNVQDKGRGLFWIGSKIEKGTVLDIYTGEIYKEEGISNRDRR